MQSTVVTRSHFWEWLSQCWCAMSEEPAAVVTLTRTDAIFVMELPEGEARFNPTSVAALPSAPRNGREGGEDWAGGGVHEHALPRPPRASAAQPAARPGDAQRVWDGARWRARGRALTGLPGGWSRCQADAESRQ